jgi:hypothetical protein
MIKIYEERIFLYLQLKPTRGLVASAIVECSFQPVLTVGCIPWRTFTDESPQVVDKLF